jgi:hypothetical protein
MINPNYSFAGYSIECWSHIISYTSPVEPYMNKNKSQKDFDNWLAFQKAKGQIIMLDYRLIQGVEIVYAERDNPVFNQFDINRCTLPPEKWPSITRILSKATISIGSYLSLN